MDQGSHACDLWTSATLRPLPKLPLLRRIPAVGVATVAPLPLADPVGSHRRVMEQCRAFRG